MTNNSHREEGSWRIQIPEEIGQRIEDRVPATEFDSVDAYVSFVLESLLRELDQQGDDGGVHSEDATEEVVPSEEADAVEERLESLGYL